MQHGGRENGNLHATYTQLEKWGIARKYVSKTIAEAERLRLVDVEPGMRRSSADNFMHTFRLTYLPHKEVNEWDHVYYSGPTNEWRRTTWEGAKASRQNRIRRDKHPPSRWTNDYQPSG